MKDWKRVILYAVIPALITGIFTVAPKIYDELSEPSSVLSYIVTKGPSLFVDGEYKTIYAIRIENSGKKSLSEVFALIRGNGKFKAITVHNDTGLLPQVSSKTASISVEKLHPAEFFTVSIMQANDTKDSTIEIVLRSKEVLGSQLINSNRGNTLFLTSALASGFSVFVMSLLVLTKGVRGNSVSYLDGNKSNFLFYIAAKFNFDCIISKYSITDINISYLRFGDMLYAIAYRGDHEKRESAILALKCMLLNKTIATSSRDLIIRNILNLDGKLSKEEINALNKRSVSVSKVVEIRNLIDEYVESPAGFIKS